MQAKVFGKTIPVVKKDLKDLNLDGFYCKKTNKIYIRKDAKGEEELRIYLHELLHAMFDRLGYTQVLENQAEELLCENIPELLVENFTCKPK